MTAIRSPKLSASFVAMTLVVYVAGCNQNSRIMQNQYLLEATGISGEPKTPGQGVLKIRYFSISSPFETHEFVYRKDKSRYVSDFYNRFLSPPAYLITDQTRLWLSQSGVFANVVDAYSSADYDYTLEGDIQAVYGDHRSPTEPNAVMEIEFFLIDEHAKRDVIIFSRKYRSVQPTKDHSAAALVEGFNACLADILTGLEADLRRLPRGVP